MEMTRYSSRVAAALTLFSLLLAPGLAVPGCANMFRGALSEACREECRRNYSDVRARGDCLERCAGPR
jgi:hypothetical protein